MIDKLFDLTGKMALVTGASSGLGRQMSKVLSKSGANIIAVARNEKRLNDLVRDVESNGGQIKSYICDLNDKDDIERLIKIINKEKTNIDILINNAGIAQMTPTDDDYLNLWDQQINVNLKAVWQLSRGIANQMITNGISGSIINISSINGGNVPYAGAAAYSATKAGVIQLSKVLAGTLAKHSIRVNTILPGLFHTELTADNIEAAKQAGNDLDKIIPLNFIAEPSDLDGLILYLASNTASRYVTGAEFVIDGGLSANCKGV